MPQKQTGSQSGKSAPKGPMTVKEAGKMGGEIRKEELGPKAIRSSATRAASVSRN